MASIDLCTLSDVRLEMETPGADTDLDPVIPSLITTASERIMDEVKREFAPATGSATHVFRARGRFVDFRPYDLRNATAVVLDPNGSAKALTLNTDYRLQPAGGDKYGVFTDLRISDYIAIDIYALRFGYVEVQVAGSWGFATVPNAAKQACIVAVRSWLRRDSIRSAMTDPDMAAAAPELAASYGLPPASRNLLRPFYRDISTL